MGSVAVVVVDPSWPLPDDGVGIARRGSLSSLRELPRLIGHSSVEEREESGTLASTRDMMRKYFVEY